MGTWPFGTRGTFSSTAATVSISPVRVRWRSNGPWRSGIGALARDWAAGPVDRGTTSARPHPASTSPTRTTVSAVGAEWESGARHDQQFPSPVGDNRPPTPGDR